MTLSAVPLRMQYTADELIRMMSTHSFYEQLAPEQRQALGAEYRRSSVGRGRLVCSTTVALLVTARRSS